MASRDTMACKHIAYKVEFAWPQFTHYAQKITQQGYDVINQIHLYLKWFDIFVSGLRESFRDYVFP